MNTSVFGNCDKCGRLVPNPSANINSVHFLLGALPCSATFCTSTENCKKTFTELNNYGNVLSSRSDWEQKGVILCKKKIKNMSLHIFMF